MLKKLEARYEEVVANFEARWPRLTGWKHPHVATFYPVPANDGGAGATVAELK